MNPSGNWNTSEPRVQMRVLTKAWPKIGSLKRAR